MKSGEEDRYSSDQSKTPATCGGFTLVGEEGIEPSRA